MQDTPKPELGEYGKTERGFEMIQFNDEYGYKCSLQESSRAVCENEDGSVDSPNGYVWLGIDDADPRLMKRDAVRLNLPMPLGEISGWMPYTGIPKEVLLSTRMHLGEKEVRGLIAHLTRWLETGRLDPNAGPPKSE